MRPATKRLLLYCPPMKELFWRLRIYTIKDPAKNEQYPEYELEIAKTNRANIWAGDR